MTRSLRSRLAILLIMANLPAAALAVGAAWRSHGATTEARVHSVVQRAELIATRAGLTLGIAEGVADTLATNVEVANAGPDCSALLQAALSMRPDYAGIVVSDASGQTICSTGSADITPSLRTSLTRAIASTGVTGDTVFLPEQIQRSDSVVLISRPFLTADGSHRAVGLLLRRDAFDAIFSPHGGMHQATLALIRSGGQIVSEFTDGGLDWKPTTPLPVGNPNDPAESLFFANAGGTEFHYAVAPVRGTLANVVLATPLATLDETDWRRFATAIAAPLLMLILGILAIYSGVERLVLRWITRLRAVSAAYTIGNYAPRLEHLDRAPSEIADLGASFNTMAERIQERSHALEVALSGKNALLKELHHRVKNNFQMIASLLAMQRRELPTRLRTLLRVPEDRVLAMASAYKASYATGEIGRVGMAELLRDIAGQLRQSFGLGAPVIHLTAEGEPVRLDLDRAVPLGLLFSEIISSALDRADAATGPIDVRILHDGPGRVKLEMISPNLAEAVPVMGLAARLTKAYRAQLAADFDTPDDDTVRIAFAIEAASQVHPGRVELGA